MNASDAHSLTRLFMLVVMKDVVIKTQLFYHYSWGYKMTCDSDPETCMRHGY